MSIEIQPYFAEGERYPALIGVRAEGDEYETAYVSKSELVDALAENDRLRELAAGIGYLLFTLDVDYCAICSRDDINHPCPVHTIKGGECLYETDLRELGVVVDG